VKIELFKSPTCVRCLGASALLRKVLAEKGVKYEDAVLERDIVKDSGAMADLLMLDLMSTPVIKYGERVLKDAETTDETRVRELLSSPQGG